MSIEGESLRNFQKTYDINCGAVHKQLKARSGNRQSAAFLPNLNELHAKIRTVALIICIWKCFEK